MTPTEDEFTELVDAEIPRVDLVDKAANGTRFLIAKQADGTAGLLDPGIVRSLIGKSQPAAEPEETVTMTGSPGAIAKLIHEAAIRGKTAKKVIKAELSAKELNDLPDSAFAYIEPGGHKDEGGKTVPRSKRHFAIHDEAHARNALSRAPQSPFGDKALPKIRAAAKKFGIDVAKEALMDDGILDAMTSLAEPDGNMPGMATDPGSPAWEAIDAATARKWTAILARAKAAIGLLVDREMLEAAAGHEDDAYEAMELEDAACAIDYAIDILAPFAIAEQAAADCGDEMQAVGKALATFDTAQLDTIEALAHVAKAGRVLSASNEAAIRGAVESLQKVLASLPAAPTTDDSGRPVAKTANEETDMPKPVPSAEVNEEAGQEPAMGAHQAEPKPVAGTAVTDMAKADGEKEMVAVYDKKGNLVGIVDPERITRIAGAESDEEPDGDEDGSDGMPDGAPQTTDLTPQPQAEAGTPADAVPDGVNKTTTDQLSDMFKSSILAAVEAAITKHSATQAAQIATTGDAILELASLVETLKGRIGTLEEQPAEPKVFTNGAVPPAHLMRGQDRGAAPVDMAKATELRKQLYAPVAADQNAAALEMQQMAIARLQEIHQGR